MRCVRCGKELDNNAVFCDGCGAFVMKDEPEELPDNGYRKRNINLFGSVWTTVLIIAVLSAMIGVFVGYRIIERDLREREAAKYNLEIKSKTPWDKRLTDISKYKYYTANDSNNAD